MRARRLFLGLCLSVLCLAAASPALGLANRVFLSARSGNDANACDNINTPCKTLQGAVGQLNPAGEAIVLDSGGYGPVTITQSVTIEAPPGVTAFIHPPSGDAIAINAPGAHVTLRGLVLNTGTTSGITVSSVDTLKVENCFISGFASADGISIQTGTSNLIVKDTDVTDCFQGIAIRNLSGTVTGSIDNTHMDANSIGFFSTGAGTSIVSITRSTANGNGQIGLNVGFSSIRTDKVVVENCVISNNATAGIAVTATGAGTEVAVSNCTVSGNGTGLLQINGVLSSRGNNTVRLNTTATSGTITPFAPI